MMIKEKLTPGKKGINSTTDVTTKSSTRLVMVIGTCGLRCGRRQPQREGPRLDKAKKREGQKKQHDKEDRPRHPATAKRPLMQASALGEGNLDTAGVRRIGWAPVYSRRESPLLLTSPPSRWEERYTVVRSTTTCLSAYMHFLYPWARFIRE